ncbi:alkylation response protein AidB-like acyl-CoA dehydrogenase [Actinomadura algeriensis]|uniref:Alkylation response protein AidB-like acyl-CoA dehydrogenase n=1 Tax=Actinomadura algeriensis TaxID=1679523 RepID=A0ABR9K2F1_9ACTN|nr:alkylation response protein AidB-like acyl-CoA dehydrogenase [Actinomadura algeriensis]
MDFELNEDQRAFRAVLRDFVDREIIPVARDWEHAGRPPAEIVEGMRKLGLFGITVPPEYGGLDLDPVSFALVFEEIARGWMGIAGVLGSHTLACRMIAAHGTADQKARYLPDLATGARRTGIRPHRAGRGHRPAGRPHDGPAATTSSTERRRGSPTRGTPTRCPSS